MKTTYSDVGYIVYKEDLSNIHSTKIKKDLCVTPESTFDTPVFQDLSFKVYRESENRFRIPRYYGIKHFGYPQNVKISSATTINLPFNGTLKKETKQDEATDSILKAMTKDEKLGGGGILSLPPGYGKTTCALYIVSKMKVKTLIVVHKEFLMNQWIERIEHFLPGARVGILRQDRVEIEDKDIVVSMLHSVSMKDYPKGTFDTFGLTVIDETHHICSKVFSKALYKFNTKYMLGLSATPERKDGLSKVLEWFIGPVLYGIERKNQDGVTVEVARFKHERFKKELPMNRMGKLNSPELINILTGIEERNELIVECIDKLFNKKRNVMILTDRREHCFYFHKLLNEKYGDNTAGLYIGGMKQEELKESEECQIIIATYSLAHEGLDIPKLDSLILASPKSDVVQACGRIMRETKGKLFSPYIIDIVDSVGPMMAQFAKRKQFYKKSGFQFADKVNVSEMEEVTSKLESYSFIEDE